jgi:hypothetical protein
LPHIFGAEHALLGVVGVGALTAVVVVEMRLRVDVGVVVVKMVEMVLPVTVTGWVTAAVKLIVLHGGCVSMHEQAVLATEAAAEASWERSDKAGDPADVVDLLLVDFGEAVVERCEIVITAPRFWAPVVIVTVSVLVYIVVVVASAVTVDVVKPVMVTESVLCIVVVEVTLVVQALRGNFEEQKLWAAGYIESAASWA